MQSSRTPDFRFRSRHHRICSLYTFLKLFTDIDQEFHQFSHILALRIIGKVFIIQGFAQYLKEEIRISILDEPSWLLSACNLNQIMDKLSQSGRPLLRRVVSEIIDQQLQSLIQYGTRFQP